MNRKLRNSKLRFWLGAGLAGCALLVGSILGGLWEVRTAEASAISGMGTLTGMVDAPKPFQAAQVYATHVEKDVVYMVYTAGGRYRAVNLFPGNYEVTVQKKGFEADVKKVTVKAGQEARVNFSLSEADADAVRKNEYAGSRTIRGDVALVPYDELYPPGPGRATAEKTCIYCHGVNFLPGNPRNEAGWNQALDYMMNRNEAFGATQGASMIPPESLQPGEREALVAYLVKHFGPGTPRRALRVDVEMPLDEEALSKAMYVEYRLANTDGMPRRRAQEPTFDHDGNVWFTERGTPSAISRLDPRTGTITDFMNPDPKGSPHGLLVDQDGFVWWAGRDVHLGRLHPESGEMVQYPVIEKGWHGHTPVLDSKQNIWFTMLPGNRIGKWDRATDKIALYEIPSQRGRPYGIVIDKDDKVWFAEFHGCQITRFDPVTEKFTEYPALTQPCLIRRLGLDSKGIVWYGVFSGGKLGRLDPSTGKIVEYDLPMPFSQPYDTWPDAEDNIWITDGGQGGALIRFNPRTEKFTYYPSPQRTDMPKVSITRDGAIWYNPRSSDRAAVGVLYPDVSKMQTLAAYF